MKTRFWQWLFAATLVVFAVLVRAAENDAPKPLPAPAEDATATKAPAAATTPAVVAQPPASPNLAPVEIIPPKLSLPPLLDQVVRLSRSGTDESVVRAYVEKAAPAYRITGNEIIELQDLGVSKAVILALVEHSKTATPSTMEAPVEPPATVQNPPAQASAPASASPPAPTEAASDYYEALSPYGTWANVPGYGWCWQPTAVVVNPSWRPYCDNGSWLWSDCGWYWSSYYSWGWAPFHYGRWFCQGNSSWYWCPDRVWGPSWVCWRSSPSYCGWAPLPPGSCFTAGVGWSYNGLSVGMSFGYGFGCSSYNFVAYGNFTDHHVSQHCVYGSAANTAYANSRVVNNYYVGANNQIVNHGFGREQVAAARGTPLQTVSVSDAARRGNALSGRTATAAASGNQPGMSRPVTLQQSRNAAPPSTPRYAATVSSSGSGQRTTPGQRATPNYSAPNRAPSVQQSRTSYANAAPRANTAPRPNAAPQMQPRYSTAINHNTVPARTFSSPNVGQRQFTSQTFASRPSFQGHAPSFAGSVSHGVANAGRAAGGGTSVGRIASAGRH